MNILKTISMKVPARYKFNMILVLVALIWGSSFIAQRAVANDLGVFVFNGARFLLGGLIILPFTPRPWNLDRKILPLVFLAGLMLFGASTLQQAGMKTTTAGNAAFITSLYVVLVPIILTVVWHQPVSKVIWGAAILAVIGVFLLSSTGPVQFSSGDGLELVGALLWAMHVIIVGHLARKIDPRILTSFQLLFVGMLNIALGVFLERSTFLALPSSMWAVIYSGIFSLGLGFTLQAVSQKYAPPADVAIILSTESVFAAVFGVLFLGEVLGLGQVSGCGLILTATVLAQRTGT